MMLERLKSGGLYLIYLAVIILLTDFLVLKQFMGFGYASHYSQNNIHRYITPYVGFTGKPDTIGHNKFGFLGPELNNSDTASIKIAFFGGSTGYRGKPTIAKSLEQHLSYRIGDSVIVSNFSVVSSHHRQHLHSILEYLANYNPDIVVFYGGFNETLHNGIYDPRPGFPFKFFIDSELSPLVYWLLKNSAILGEIDKNYGTLSGIDRLRKSEKPFSEEWNEKIIKKYFETLDLASRVSGIMKSKKFDTTKFMTFYQPFKVVNKINPVHQSIRSKIPKYDYIYDVSNAYDSLDDPYTDWVHVKQFAREHMAQVIADSIYFEFFKPKKSNLE